MTFSPRIGVTGANGYVGQIMTRAASRAGDVVSLVRVPRRPGDRLWSLEMSEEEMRNALVSSGITHVIHAAWNMRARSLEQLESSCVAGTERLLSAARSSSLKSFIFISTISAFDETRSAYGKAKLLTERSVGKLANGLVLRLGLVYGDEMGGMFGSLSRLAARLPVMPLVSGGPGFQYLLHEESLSEAVVRAIQGDFDSERRALTLAYPKPILLRDLMTLLAARHGRNVVFVRLDWRILYITIGLVEMLGMNFGTSRDSLISFIFQNPKPDFAPLFDHDIKMASISGEAQKDGITRTQR